MSHFLGSFLVSEAQLLRWFRKNYEGLFDLDYSKCFGLEAMKGRQEHTQEQDQLNRIPQIPSACIRLSSCDFVDRLSVTAQKSDPRNHTN